jgi:signal transduction histidine kinase
MTKPDRHRRGAEPSHPELDRVAEVLRENQKLITLGRLTASIAHEINNPLESITNLLYLIEQDSPENAPEYLRIAQRELNRVVQISKQTLTFSRETSTPVRVEMAELIEEVLGLYAHRISEKNLSIVRQYDTREEIRLLPGEMRQVLSNLIANAVEATAPQGRIVIRIRKASYWSAKGAEPGIRISIGDSGSGIPSEVRSLLGQPFFTTKGQRGTGLGLWVTQSILSRYGSGLQIRSSVGSVKHGTVFSFVLPLGLRPIKVISGGGEMEGLPKRSPRSGGLRLVGHGSVPAVREPEDASDMTEAATRPLRLRASGR